MSQQQGQALMEKIVSLCKRRGFIFPGSEIYGGLGGTWDYGPLGVEMKNNIKQEWWRRFVHQRTDMVGMDGSLVMNAKVWEASGHLSNFQDPLFECKKCHKRFRIDDIYHGEYKGVSGLKSGGFKIKEKNIKCPNCQTEWPEEIEFEFFNLLFKTFIGPVEDSANVAYFRPETAQSMFVNFKNVLESTRKRIPFGIAQVGKVFRNEITPGNFIFRVREFEQMEIEYFIREKDWKSAFKMWQDEMVKWIRDLGIDVKKKIKLIDIPDGERAHYSKKTIDFEYQFPFGQKELYGLAYRTDFDLKNHTKFSGQDLIYTDPESGEKFTPHVIEPTWGVDRTVLAALIEAYNEEEVNEEIRVVLKLPIWLAPIKVAILPLSKKKELSEVARPIYNELTKYFVCEYDETQSIGKRYRRQDEIGTPYCVTVDFDSLEDKKVTVRDRDTMKQERVAVTELTNYLTDKLTT